MTTGDVVWKTVFSPWSTSWPSSANSGPRWSIVGAAIARRMRSGVLVGPGICRKWRPRRVIGHILSRINHCRITAPPMNLAVISVSALALAVVISCVSRLNVGVLSVAMAWVVGVYIGGLPVNTVMAGFPSQLFLTLTGVTLLFAMAQSNGTLSRLAHHAVGACRGNAGTIPIMFFVLGALLSSMGPGNIATAALLTPIAMATAVRAGIPLFLMAIMVGNGANAGALSPFAPTGIIVNGIMARNGLPGFAAQTYLYNLAAHSIVAFAGYAMFGGLKLFGVSRAAPSGEAC